MAFVAAAVSAGILTRPRAVPESAFAVAGAAIVLLIGAISPGAAADVLWGDRGVFAFLAG